MDVNVAAWTLIYQSIHLSPLSHLPLSHTAIHYKQAFLILDFELFHWSICFPEMHRILKYHFSQEIYLRLFLRAKHLSYVCLSTDVTFCVYLFWVVAICWNIHLKILTDLKLLFKVSEMCLYTRLLLSSHFKGAPSHWQELKFILWVMLCHWLWFLYACKACVKVKRWILNSWFRNIRCYGAKRCLVNRFLALSGVFTAS